MENRIEKALELLTKKPYLVTMGANTVARRYGYSRQEITEAKKLFYKRRALKRGPQILIFDIETSPMKAYVWKRWMENISLDQTISEWFMICWAAKWLGEEEVYSSCLTPSEIAEEDDKRITEELWKLLDEADIVVAHNGKKFDIPKMNSRFILNGLPPCSPYKQIDTCEVSKKSFGFSSSKLDALATYFGFPNKDKTDFNLWKACLEGNQKALEYMAKYNIKDVVILEKVYIKLRSWIPNHPNSGLYIESDKPVCPICGSTHMELTSDFKYTHASKFKVMRCTDCGGIARVRNNAYPKDKKNSLVLSV